MPSNKSHRAILIDAKKAVIREVTVSDYTDIQKHIECDCFTSVSLGNGETLYVDDEGLINGTRHGFTIDYGNGGLMGNGLIVGTALDGDTKDTKLALSDLKDKFGIAEAFLNEDGTFFHKTLLTEDEVNKLN